MCSLCTESFLFNAFVFLCRDLRLHRLVFESELLPNGTELAYYAGAQVSILTLSFLLST